MIKKLTFSSTEAEDSDDIEYGSMIGGDALVEGIERMGRGRELEKGH